MVGTIETATKIRYYLLPEMDKRFLRLLLVGSCVPEKLVSNLLKADEKGKSLQAYAKEMVEKFKEIREEVKAFEKKYPEIVGLQNFIAEDEILKVLEQPLTNEGIEQWVIAGGRNKEPSSSITRDKIAGLGEEIILFGDEALRRKSSYF